MKPCSDPCYANVHSIETFGAFDGPGIRFVLFLQGCPFQCKYCHNRDTWSTKENKKMTVDDVYEMYTRYQAFYKKGGITVSGGEPLLQIQFLIELFTKFKEKGIHTCIDSSAACYDFKRQQQFDTLLDVTDLFLLDIKHIDEVKHQDLTGSSNQQVLAFTRYLSRKKKDIVIRHVLIPGINDDEASLLKLRSFLDTLDTVIDIEVLGYHTKGIYKWEALGLSYPLEGVREASKEDVAQALHILKDGYSFRK